jgi:hypothetical protein
LKQIKVISKVVNGKLIRNRAKVKQAVQSFEGNEIEIIVKRKTNHRSNQQNAYYFGVVIPITIQAVENEWGETWDIEKAHNLYKSLFLYEEKVNPETSEVIKVPTSSTENTTTKQEVFHTQCRDFLKEWFNVEVPLPNEEIVFN